MDEIQEIIEDCVSIAKDKMIGEMLHVLGEQEAYRLVRKYEDYCMGLYSCTRPDDDASNVMFTFTDAIVRCCSDYWKDIFTAGTVIP